MAAGAVGPRTFTLRTTPQRIVEVGDLWQGVEGQPSGLGGALTKLETQLTEEDWREAHAASTRRPTSRQKQRQSQPGRARVSNRPTR